MDDQHKPQNEVEVQPSLGGQLQICEHYKSRLYPYQVEGLQFLHSACREGRKGVILADEMGLGKSIQVISFLACKSKKQKIPSILLVVPLHLSDDWVTKINDWAPWMTCMKYHPSEPHQDKNLKKVKRKGGIIITTYRMIVSHKKDLSSFQSKPYIWDFLVCDEAHRLKNEKTQAYKVASSLQAHFRILLTGTPIQNNLKEFWNLLSLISETCLVGTYQTFRKNFEKPITRGREADAGADERALAQELMECLKEKIKLVWLRRTKDQLPKLPNKREFVLWTKLSPEQETIYRHQTSVNEAHNVTSNLLLLHKLRMICSHPKTFDGSALNSDQSEAAYSGKLAILIPLLKTLSSKGHKILVFFQYVQTLKIVLHSLMKTDWGQRTVLFMDGTVVLRQRMELLKSFQHGSRSILLLTVQVGAEGLTLTTADRVIIMEPSWNQSADAQAVDRVHRIGQRRVVEVYRLITCGTIEEKIYRRQLFKGSLVRQVLGDDQNPLRHFTRSELMELNSLGETQYSATQLQLERQNSKRLSAEDILGRRLGEQVSGNLCGISDHGQLLEASQGDDLEAEMEKLHIADEVQKSKEEIEDEAHLKCPIVPIDVPRHHKIPQKSLGLHLKGKKNASIWNDYQNKQKASLSRESVPKPVYSKKDSRTTPGFPQKYKCFKCSIKLTHSIWRKRHIVQSSQYGSNQSYFPFSKKESSCVKDGAAHIKDPLLITADYSNEKNEMRVESPAQTHKPSTTHLPPHGFMTMSSGNCINATQYPHVCSGSNPDTVSVLAVDKSKHSRMETPLRNNGFFADVQSPRQMKGLIHTHKPFSPYLPPIPLLCDYPITPETVSVPNTPHMEKTQQVSDDSNERSEMDSFLSYSASVSLDNMVPERMRNDTALKISENDNNNAEFSQHSPHNLTLDSVDEGSEVDTSDFLKRYSDDSNDGSDINSSLSCSTSVNLKDMLTERTIDDSAIQISGKDNNTEFNPHNLTLDSVDEGSEVDTSDFLKQYSDDSNDGSDMSSFLSCSTSVSLDDMLPERVRDDTALQISETDNNDAEFSQQSPHNLTLDSVDEGSEVDTSDFLKRYSDSRNDGNDMNSFLSCSTSVNLKDILPERVRDDTAFQISGKDNNNGDFNPQGPHNLTHQVSDDSNERSEMNSFLSYSASVSLDDMVPERIRDDTALKISETDNNDAEFSQQSPHSLTLDSVDEGSEVDISDCLKRYSDDSNNRSDMSSFLSCSASVNLDDMVPERVRDDTAFQISGKDNNSGDFSPQGPHNLTLASVDEGSEVDTSDFLKRYSDDSNDGSDMNSSLLCSTSVNLKDMLTERTIDDSAIQISGKDNNAKLNPHNLTLDSVDEGSEVNTSDFLKRYSDSSNDGSDMNSSLSCSTSVNDIFAELQLPRQHGPIQTLKSPSPITLLCDYSLTPGSLSLPSSPHTGKETQVSDVCLASDHKDECVPTPRRECFRLLQQLKDL